jgi:hypothetical protein
MMREANLDIYNFTRRRALDLAIASRRRLIRASAPYARECIYSAQPCWPVSPEMQPILLVLGACAWPCVALASLLGRDEEASSFAGSTTTAVFPPLGVTATTNDPLFPDGSQVGFLGPTPSMFHVATHFSRSEKSR